LLAYLNVNFNFNFNIFVYGSLICIFFMNTFGKGSIIREAIDKSAQRRTVLNIEEH